MVIMPRDHELARLSRHPAGRSRALFSDRLRAADALMATIVGHALAASRRTLRIDTVVRFTPVACSLVQAGAGVGVVDEFVIRGGTWPEI